MLQLLSRHIREITRSSKICYSLDRRKGIRLTEKRRREFVDIRLYYTQLKCVHISRSEWNRCMIVVYIPLWFHSSVSK